MNSPKLLTISVVFLFVHVFAPVSASSLIDKWGRCKITDPNLSECLTKACAKMVEDLRPGNKENNIPPWEPFAINKMVLKSGGKGPVNMEMIIEDAKCIGITQFSELIVDASKLKDMVLKMSIMVPKMNVTTKYKMSGNMLAVPVKGNGDAKFMMTDTRMKVTIKGKPVEKGGKTYWNVDNFDILFLPTKMKMEFTGLFNGDKKLGDATNKVLNENWQVMNKEFQPHINSEFGKTAIPIANIITHMEPFDEMFPK